MDNNNKLSTLPLTLVIAASVLALIGPIPFSNSIDVFAQSDTINNNNTIAA